MVAHRLTELIRRGCDRGRDSFGVTCVSEAGTIVEMKELGSSSMLGDDELFIGQDTTVVLNNNRAEPTTEWVAEKSEVDIQPFTYDGWIVAHNGVIANDRELAEQYGVTPYTSIDSGVLPAVMSVKSPDGLDAFVLRDFLRDEVLGSFAAAFAHTSDPYRVILATNYKPLYVEYDQDLKTVFWSSLEGYLKDPNKKIHEEFQSHSQVKEMPPYTLWEIVDTPKGLLVNELSLRKDRQKNSALVVCSGGLDSTVAATWAAREGLDVTLLHFDYGARAREKELQAVENICAAMGWQFITMDMRTLFQQIGGSRLTNTLDELVTADEGAAGAEYAHEWVPARNLVMLSLATAVAESAGFPYIVLGNNLEEAGAYPDNEMQFINKLNEVLPYATNLHHYVEILMPVGNLMKHEIVRTGLELDAPMDLTWSCYEGGTVHCGTCGPCFMRKKAFEMNGQTDPVFLPVESMEVPE